MDTNFFLKSIQDGMASFASEIQKEIESVTKVGEDARKKIEQTTKEIMAKADKEIKEVVSKYASRLETVEKSLTSLEQTVSTIEPRIRTSEDNFRRELDTFKIEHVSKLEQGQNSNTTSIADLQKKLTSIIEKAKTISTILSEKK